MGSLRHHDVSVGCRGVKVKKSGIGGSIDVAVQTPAFRYWAFISYSHADEAWAKWLHAALEKYRVPRRLVGTEGPLGARPARLLPVFRDRDELSPSAELSSVIEAALRESRYLIVICSPRSAKSRWVDAEIRRFKSLGYPNRVLALIVDGEPDSADADQTCFPPALVQIVDAKGQWTGESLEPIAADARPFADHKRGALLKLIAALLGVGYDELRQRERERRFWTRVQYALAGVGVLAMMVGLWGAFQQRERERLAQLRIDQLIDLGRQELREDQHARASVYFAEALRSGRDTHALRYWLARAMQPVDAVDAQSVDIGAGVTDARMSADGKHALIMLRQTVEWWDLQNGRRLQRFPVQIDGSPTAPEIIDKTNRAVVNGVADAREGIASSQAHILDLEQGNVVASVPGTMWFPAGRRVSPDGRTLLLSISPPEGDASSFYVAAHDLLDGRQLATLRSPQGTGVPSFSDDGRFILTGGEGTGEIRIWDAQTYQLVRGIQPRQRLAHSAYWSGRGYEILSINEAGALKLWDGMTGELLDALGSHNLFALGLGRALQRYWLTSSIDGTKVWDLERGQAIFSSDQFGGFDGTSELDPSGQRILGHASQSGGALWNVPEQAREFRLDVHERDTIRQFFDPASGRILSLSASGKFRWLRTAGLARPLARLQHNTYINPMEGPGVRALRLSRDGQQWLSGGADGKLRRWDIATGELVTEYATSQGALVAIEHVVQPQRVLAADSQGTLYAWAEGTVSPTWTWSAGEGEAIVALAGNIASDVVAVLLASGGIVVLGAEDGAVRRSFPADERVRSVRLIAHGQRLLVGYDHSIPSVWSIASGEKLFALGNDTDEKRYALGVAIASDAGFALIAFEDGELSRWRLQDGQRLGYVEIPESLGATARFETLAISQDNNWVAAASKSGAILLTHLVNGESKLLQGNQNPVEELSFDPQHRVLAGGSRKGDVLLWDLASGVLLDRLGKANEPISGLNFDPAGARIAYLTRLDDAVRVWAVHSETREFATILARIECAVPWRLESKQLVATAPKPSRCNGDAVAP